MYRNCGMLCLWQAKRFASRNLLSGGTIVKKSVVTLLLCGAMVLAMAGCGNSGAGDAEKDLQQSQETYGAVERESCDVLVAKFNTEVVDNSALNPASADYLTEDHDQYWYGLLEGVYLVVVPETYTGDPKTDIVDYMLIYADSSGEYGDEAVAYAKHLVKANDNAATEAEITTLLEQAKAQAASGKTAYNGRGIAVGYLETSDAYQYQVLRFYKG